jgi:hypothetical protein
VLTAVRAAALAGNNGVKIVWVAGGGACSYLGEYGVLEAGEFVGLGWEVNGGRVQGVLGPFLD